MSSSTISEIFFTNRLRVRKYSAADMEHFFALHGNEEVMRYIRPAKTREESNAFLLEIIANYDLSPQLGRWAVEDKSTGEMIGSFAVIPIPGEPENIQLGYALLPEHWGKGYATELTRAGMTYSFSKLNLPIIYGVAETPNLSSQRVLLKAGFKPCGTKMEEEKELRIFSATNPNQEGTP